MVVLIIDDFSSSVVDWLELIWVSWVEVLVVWDRVSFDFLSSGLVDFPSSLPYFSAWFEFGLSFLYPSVVVFLFFHFLMMKELDPFLCSVNRLGIFLYLE